MRVQLPDNELGFDVAFRGSEGPFESVQVLTLALGPASSMSEASR